MTPAHRAVTERTLGAWLVKANRGVSSVDELVRTGFASVTGWCVRPSYRTRLVAPGQPVLFWVSGGDSQCPSGLHAQGHTAGPAEADTDGSTPVLPLRLVPLAPPVLRSELLAHPALRRIEVLRMAAGSNPSFLTRTELDELRAQWPQVTVG